MSSKATSETPLLEEVKTVREKYRRKQLHNQLNSIAELMEETILQAELANELFGCELTIAADAKSDVKNLRSLLDEEDFDALEGQIDDVKETLEAENQRITSEITDKRSGRRKTVQAMQRLNDRVERYDSGKLDELYSLFEKWDWQAEISEDETDTFEERQLVIQEFGQTRAEWLSESKEELFGRYRDTEMWEILHPILNQERLTYGDLSETQRKELADSELAEYLELQLS